MIKENIDLETEELEKIYIYVNSFFKLKMMKYTYLLFRLD